MQAKTERKEVKQGGEEKDDGTNLRFDPTPHLIHTNIQVCASEE